ncbi:hypothetical protein [Rubellimicrobium aerolatum]|uniref:Uncharacterized protein n=1 Tax=Rubellimicrobium aerolatum TaxID=490979 RepID=A0ABW0SFE2_9RHOB|nr:hypothetical protein [Rubellimicrobium aerolatum]MBP1806505.1 hypothetical protein [Rubellimicrobium aerolatum]
MRRPITAAVLLSALALTACQTPREACLSSASRDLRVIDSLVRETQGNLRRGYAIEQSQEVRVRRDFCRVRDDDGDTRLIRCDDTDVIDVSRPVAIDLNAEQAKLDSLLERRARLAREQEARVEACRTAYPE